MQISFPQALFANLQRLAVNLYGIGARHEQKTARIIIWLGALSKIKRIFRP